MVTSFMGKPFAYWMALDSLAREGAYDDCIDKLVVAKARIEALEKALAGAKAAAFLEASNDAATALTVLHAVGLVVDATLATAREAKTGG